MTNALLEATYAPLGSQSSCALICMNQSFLNPFLVYYFPFVHLKFRFYIMINISRYVRPKPLFSTRFLLSKLTIPSLHLPLSSFSSHSHSHSPKKKTEVPIASYTKPKASGTNVDAERTVLMVDESEPTAPTSIAGEDVTRKAVAFDRTIVSKMTPTMKRFTLEGKVAVVTG